MLPRRGDANDMLLDQWRISEIEKAIGEADRGEFASARDVQRALRKWMDVHGPQPKQL